MKIWAHMLVCNEERYLWYAVMSVIGYVDKILLWDTGSTDQTVEICKEIQKLYKSKVSFRQKGSVTKERFTRLRQEMLEQTKGDWFLIVDGDEVWWDGSIRQVVETIQERGVGLDSIVSPFYNLIGDIYHYQEEAAGMYKIDGRVGHMTIRAMNRSIPGLHFENPYGQEGLYDNKKTPLQKRSKRRRLFLDSSYMHFTNLRRSSEFSLEVLDRDLKLKREIGIPFPRDFYYPEVFFRDKPNWIWTPWENLSGGASFLGLLEMPLKRFQRRIIKGVSRY